MCRNGQTGPLELEKAVLSYQICQQQTVSLCLCFSCKYSLDYFGFILVIFHWHIWRVIQNFDFDFEILINFTVEFQNDYTFLTSVVPFIMGNIWKLLLCHMKKGPTRNILNPFVPNTPFLYHQNISENRKVERS